MDKYESPTVEQVGGPNSHSEPEGIPDFFAVAEPVLVAIAAAVVDVGALWNYTWTWNRGGKGS